MKKVILLLILASVHLATIAQSLEQIIPQVKSAIFTVHALDDNGVPISQGSGFFISPSGIGITNFHVLENASGAYISDSKGNIINIKTVIDYNPDLDLVKFKVDNNTATPHLQIANHVPLQGTKIISYGTPKGFENSVSTGIISAIRNMPNYGKVIQITAPISPGSSGSPVLNYQKQVVGVSTFNYIGGQNLNFAIDGQSIHSLRKNLNIPVAAIVRNHFQTKAIRTACALGEGGEYYKAIQLLNKELFSTPNNHLALYYRGVYKCRSRMDYEGGLHDMDNACKLQGFTDFIYLMHYAVFLKNILVASFDKRITPSPQLVEKTIKILELAAKTSPESSEPFSTLAYILYTSNKHDKDNLHKALLCINHAIELDATEENLTIRAEIRGKTGDYGGALLDCDKAIEANSSFYRAFFVKGNIEFFDMRAFNAGLIDIEKALSLASNEEPYVIADILALRGLAKASKAMVELGSDASVLIAQALTDLEAAYKLYPNPTYQEHIKEITNDIDNYLKTHQTFP